MVIEIPKMKADIGRVADCGLLTLAVGSRLVLSPKLIFYDILSRFDIISSGRQTTNTGKGCTYTTYGEPKEFLMRQKVSTVSALSVASLGRSGRGIEDDGRVNAKTGSMPRGARGRGGRYSDDSGRELLMMCCAFNGRVAQMLVKMTK